MKAELTKVPAVLFCCFMIAAGGVLIYGAYRRWPILVDPPKSWRFFYSQSAMRAFLGQKAVLFYTYLLGVLFVAGGVVALWNGLR